MEDSVVLCYMGSSGRAYAMGVFVRVNTDLFIVHTPAQTDPDSMATYWEFIKSPPASAAVSFAQFDREAQVWNLETATRRVEWQAA